MTLHKSVPSTIAFFASWCYAGARKVFAERERDVRHNYDITREQRSPQESDRDVAETSLRCFPLVIGYIHPFALSFASRLPRLVRRHLFLLSSNNLRLDEQRPFAFSLEREKALSQRMVRMVVNHKTGTYDFKRVLSVDRDP